MEFADLFNVTFEIESFFFFRLVPLTSPNIRTLIFCDVLLQKWSQCPNIFTQHMTYLLRYQTYSTNFSAVSPSKNALRALPPRLRRAFESKMRWCTSSSSSFVHSNVQGRPVQARRVPRVSSLRGPCPSLLKRPSVHPYSLLYIYLYISRTYATHEHTLLDLLKKPT